MLDKKSKMFFFFYLIRHKEFIMYVDFNWTQQILFYFLESIIYIDNTTTTITTLTYNVSS